MPVDIILIAVRDSIPFIIINLSFFNKFLLTFNITPDIIRL